MDKYDSSQSVFAPPQEPNDFFIYPALRFIINTVHQQTQKDAFLTLISGESGCGKTCLIEYLVQHSSDSPYPLKSITATKSTTTSQLLVNLVPEHLLPQSTDPHKMAYQAARVLFKTLKQHKKTGVLIDNASSLSSQALVTLITFFAAINNEQQGHISLFLFGDHNIESRVHKLTPAPCDLSGLYNIRIKAMDKQTRQDYINFCFKNAGIDPIPLNKKQLATIQTQSGGLPSRINQLIEQTLS